MQPLLAASGIYQAVVVLHVLAVVGGFGALLLNRSGGSVSKLAEPLIYAVPVLGIVAVLLSEDRWKFSQPWVSASFVLYIAAVGVYHGGLKKDPRQPVLGAAFDLLVVLAIAVMVVKPGI